MYTCADNKLKISAELLKNIKVYVTKQNPFIN